MKGTRLFFKLGAWGYLLTGIFHLAGHVAGPATPANETERTLLDLATTYRYDLGAFQRSLMDFMNGFSLVFTVFCLFAATVAFLIVRSGNDALIRGAAILFCGVSGIVLVLACVYFFVPPIVCFAVIFACELGAVALSRGAGRATAV